ncbi:MAG: hypothetical protein UT63_C0053G0004 [Candidatus Gottesmanbacteria bacterium GW2011_GWC2_39_8]|uniref:Uncharacterized protein n=1 Tax=Candidatus Gottesmanbacteria bacterium GW2011_GWC2_39_8 TaxID=1618450 RepID=A0A0G0PVU8_9BACT|nr:MAG: hypothetical protein UT63_C0053G0004 [Candidatus Gottesmanbacteria bacterium GW2011_GWC2_39_8]
MSKNLFFIVFALALVVLIAGCAPAPGYPTPPPLGREPGKPLLDQLFPTLPAPMPQPQPLPTLAPPQQQGQSEKKGGVPTLQPPSAAKENRKALTTPAATKTQQAPDVPAKTSSQFSFSGTYYLGANYQVTIKGVSDQDGCPILIADTWGDYRLEPFTSCNRGKVAGKVISYTITTR